MHWLKVLIPFLFLMAGQTMAATGMSIVDIAGRHVELKQVAKRFVIGEGRYVLTLSLLRPENPVEGLVGMMQPVSWTYPDLEQQLFSRFPAAKNIALFGHQDRSSISVEKMIDLKPDVAIFGVQDHGPGAENAELIRQLESAGVKVVFIDFRLNPLQNTIPSVRILGQVLGAEDRAEQYIKFYQQHRDRVTQAVATVKTRPSVFLQAHAGRFDCCTGMADGMLGPFVTIAGGHNIADSIAPGPTSRHTMEFLLVQNPDVWIGTASGGVADVDAGKSWVALGPGMTDANAREGLRQYLSADEFQAMDAVRNNRAYAVWHDFYNSPLNIVALEAFAKWIHPELLTDLDPEKTMQHIFQTFTPFTWDGVATTSIQPRGAMR